MTMTTEEARADSATGPSDSTRQKRWFNHIKRQLKRENMDRRYYAASDHVWMGMNDIWWAITHPHKSVPRNIGQLTALMVLASVFGTAGYLFFGEPGSAQVDLEQPSSLFKVAVDKTLRPVGRFLRAAGSSIEVRVENPDDVEEYNGADYRR
ncbi:MAG: hypothetical protein AAF085_15400 [Planctomycetota bacterium]